MIPVDQITFLAFEDKNSSLSSEISEKINFKKNFPVVLNTEDLSEHFEYVF
jgi:hypothetical protein